MMDLSVTSPPPHPPSPRALPSPAEPLVGGAVRPRAQRWKKNGYALAGDLCSTATPDAARQASSRAGVPPHAVSRGGGEEHDGVDSRLHRRQTAEVGAADAAGSPEIRARRGRGFGWAGRGRARPVSSCAAGPYQGRAHHYSVATDPPHDRVQRLRDPVGAMGAPPHQGIRRLRRR